MSLFEISSKKTRSGQRKFKAVLHEIYPDDCIDPVEKTGSVYNSNGCTWIREYVEKYIDSVKDKSIRVEFVTENKDEAFGHGFTGVEPDGLPTFEDATVIGHFTDAYIDEIEDSDNNKKTVLIGTGVLDEFCYPHIIQKLIEDINNGNPPYASVEIYRADDEDAIVYLAGKWTETGRIPVKYQYSGLALLGSSVTPADKSSMLLELNNKNPIKEEEKMSNEEIVQLAASIAAELHNAEAVAAEINSACEAKIAEKTQEVEAITAERNQIEASAADLKAALEKIQEEYAALNTKYDELWQERCTLEKALAEAQARERLAALDKAIENFSDEEKAYADAEIAACREDPMNHEINSIVSKIYESIGMKAKKEADEAVVAEQNSAKEPETEIDIFGAIEIKTATEDVNIFD